MYSNNKFLTLVLVINYQIQSLNYKQNHNGKINVLNVILTVLKGFGEYLFYSFKRKYSIHGG